MKKRILVVDDEPDVSKSIVFRLQKRGYAVTAAFDGQEALDRVVKEKPDLIFLDLKLPVLDGYEVCRRVKGDPSLKKIPVIFLTADTSVGISESAKEAGAEGFILKPFEPEEIFAIVGKYLDGSDRKREAGNGKQDNPGGG